MIHSEPAINSTTMRTPNASAMTLLVLSAPVVMCRKDQMHADLTLLGQSAEPDYKRTGW